MLMGLPVAPGETLPALPDDIHGYRGRTMLPEEEEQLALIPWPKAQGYLRALLLLGFAGKAQEAAGVASGNTTYWRDHSETYRTLEDAIKDTLRENANTLASDRVYNGFLSRMYDKNGNPAGSKVSQDPGFTRAWLASIDPAWRPNEDKAPTIQIQILQKIE
jgi:hypothetical protein